ncbi:hypothetical protein N7462_001375 [Penicillium macrosclerotiorum]|uniref:uncharacterized protein n=1 Tax=Penicillium macrosclerotiorum TaxID=303699 RepID=UPI002548BC5E|nr:uncharacterized protein N7462_001375 [Penicillium macrosclerotiorum]KAJ5691952.1 hypothetical protein N7462_001375 [Penicillium macrosclerotiorum]
MPTEKFAWEETAPHRWERDIDEVETFYTTLAKRFEGTGRTFFAMTCHVSIKVDVIDESVLTIERRVIEALREAWVCLRYDHPLIASWVEYHHEAKRCRKVYEGLPKTNQHIHQSAWLNETFKIISNGQTGQEWCNSDPPVPKLPTLFLVKNGPCAEHGEFQADLILRAQHDVIDGIGSLHLMNNLFRHAARAYGQPEKVPVHRFGDEWKNLSPPLRIAADIPLTLTSEQEVRLKGIVRDNLFLREEIEVATLPFRFGRTIPGRHQRLALEIPSQTTYLVLRACKELGASVTHVYHAAIAVLMGELQECRPQRRVVRYINYSLINERHHCREPFNTAQHAASVYHSISGKSLAIDLTVTAINDEPLDTEQTRQKMMDAIEQVKEYYTSIRNDTEHITMVPSIWSLSTPAYPSGSEIPPVPAPNESPSASISSLGVIDQIISPKHGIFEIFDPWVTGEELGTGLGLFLATFNGRMGLSAAYNDAWHDKAEVMDFLTRCHGLVLTTLGVSS